MSVKFVYTKSALSESIMVTGEYVRTIASTSPRFTAVRDYLINTSNDAIDADYLLRLIDAAPHAYNTIQRLSERVYMKDGKLHFDGDLLDNSLSRHIVRMILEGDDNYPSFVAFLENLAQNPSRRSRQQLFNWLSDRDFTITTDGRFIAYKGITFDGLSVHSGYAIVNGVEYKSKKIPNAVGDIVEIPRAMVDDDPESGCSVGLHAGTLSYAKGFAPRLLRVAINPRDVVSVPKDAYHQKLRTCRYEVLEENSEAVTETTYDVTPYEEDEDFTEQDATHPDDDLIEDFDDDEFEDDDVEEGEQCTSCGDFLNEGEEDFCDDCDAEIASGEGTPLDEVVAPTEASEDAEEEAEPLPRLKSLVDSDPPWYDPWGVAEPAPAPTNAFEKLMNRIFGL